MYKFALYCSISFIILSLTLSVANSNDISDKLTSDDSVEMLDNLSNDRIMLPNLGISHSSPVEEATRNKTFYNNAIKLPKRTKLPVLGISYSSPVEEATRNKTFYNNAIKLPKRTKLPILGKTYAMKEK